MGVEPGGLSPFQCVCLILLPALLVMGSGCNDDTAVSPTIVPPTASSARAATIPPATAPPGGDNPPAISDLALPPDPVPRFDKLEFSFDVETMAQNRQWPYDPAPPPGVPAGTGVSVDALFTPDEWQTVYIQPAFYYQHFITNTVNGRDWLYPTTEYEWRVRFTPDAVGEWQVKVRAEDAGGVAETEPLPFQVISSDEKGFLRVAENDSRYFEFEDGTYFPALSVNAGIKDPAQMAAYGNNKIQLIRTWLPSQWSIFGAAWSPWASFGAAPRSQEPNARLRYDAAPPFSRDPGTDPPLAVPGHEFFLWLSHDERTFGDGQQWNLVPCAVIGWNTPPIPLKPDTDYRLRVRFRALDLAGPLVAGEPYGFTVKTGEWLWSDEENGRCYYPGSGALLAATYEAEANPWSVSPDPEYDGWSILTAPFPSGDAHFLNRLYLALENARAGSVLVDQVWLEEMVGDGGAGPNVIYKSSMAMHQYFDQRGSFAFDRALRRAAAHDLYLKLVVLEKNDLALNVFQSDGTLSPQLPHRREDSLFWGDRREENGRTKTRWLQQAWWRYLQARWSYSPHIHSWELLNEGPPGNERHYILADEMGKYFAETFIPPDQDSAHPHQHLVTTSFWLGFPRDAFWANQAYSYVDFADIHHYAQESNVEPLDYIYELDDFYDSASFTRKLSLYHGALAPGGAQMPLVRGEVAWDFDGFDPFSQHVANGVWLHNFLWGGINAGGLIESFWTGAPMQHQLARPEGHDNRPAYRAYHNFIHDVPLNNGRYQSAAAQVSTDAFRVWGQKDEVAGAAHLWIQNAAHTWRHVLEGETVPPASGSIILTGFQPDVAYTAQWWDTYQPDAAAQILHEETLTAAADGSLTLTIMDLQTDTAVKIFPAEETSAD